MRRGKSMTLFKDPIQGYLTAGPCDGMARATFAGMAHFAGTGPELKTCRECQHWDHGGPHDYYAKRGKFGGLIKPARCRKYGALTNAAGDKVPDDAPACKHFTDAAVVPARFARG
jgi:hypothetical protein